ncbi:GyrI-like domain-containing protein [Collinsella tanakaei]|uniref:GyrI-like domain-containing protein n=1 Tax=Collinsella tanakaei TaxID=626935 RepID=UPI001957347D|nr:GyrI-like domain-containing protein [Collinsella tanakaei]MBM6756661.1 GyrI-like domain-containing protein [Collinsella tanakaei]
MAYDYKKEFRDLYQPKMKPAFVDVPAMTFVVVAGTGDPNEEDGAYARALSLLYGFSYTVKMSKKGSWQPDGYFDYVVPPLEGLWWAGAGTFDGAAIADKTALSWVSLIRQPDFVTPEVFDRVCSMLAQTKPELVDALAAGALRLVRFAEGPCAQIMHKGPYDDEPETVAKLTAFIESEGLVSDIAAGGESPAGHRASAAFDGTALLDVLDADGDIPAIRLHHEIYLGDPRKTKPENLKTVIRHPVRAREA